MDSFISNIQSMVDNYYHVEDMPLRSSEFKKELQHEWFKECYKRVETAMTSRSQDSYHREMGRMFYDIDALPDLDDDLRLDFHKHLVFPSFLYEPRQSSRWVFGIQNCKEEDLMYIATHIGHHYAKCYINENGLLFGFIVLISECQNIEVEYMLGPSSNSKPVGTILLHEYDKYINEEPGHQVWFGNKQLREQVRQQELDKLFLEYRTKHSNWMIGRHD